MDVRWGDGPVRLRAEWVQAEDDAITSFLIECMDCHYVVMGEVPTTGVSQLVHEECPGVIHVDHLSARPNPILDVPRLDQRTG